MGMRGRGMGEREFGLGRLLNDPAVRQQLGVSADQAAKIRQQESDFRKSEIRNRADLQIKRLDLNDLLSAEKPDRTAIDSKLQEIGAAQIAMEKSMIDNRLNMREALTPIQRQKLEQMMAQRRQPMAGGPAPGGKAAPRGFQGGGRGGRGATPTPNPPGQPPPNR
jgi:Spy/CpxP family protein refolding chaperone